jgi:NADPH:quinone reductase-like Zn-dependent oxidoreductase/NADP-dependent 3-hydroxy acid dehydrogenase YdfG
MAQVFPTGNGFHPEDTYLPISIERVRTHQPIPEQGQLFAHTLLVSSSPESGSFRVNVRLLDAEGDVLVEVIEMEVKRVAHQESVASIPSLYTIRWALESAPEQLDIAKISTANWIVFADAAGVADSMNVALELAGGRLTTVRPGDTFRKLSSTQYEVRADSREDHERLFAEIGATVGAPTAVVHLWTLDIGERRKPYTASELMGCQAVGSQHVPLVVQACAAANWQNPPRLWIATAGSMTVGEHGEVPRIDGAPMWGIGRAVACEHPELHATLVDLSELPTPAEARELARQISLNGDEDRIALRGNDRYVARLAAHTTSDPAEERLGDGEEYRFEITSAGVLDHLALRAFHPRPPGPGEVAIDVVASGLNFIDVAKSMGIYPGLDPAEPVGLGLECSGHVVAVGQGVTAFAPGDEVIVVAPSGRDSMLASQVTIPAKWAFKKPSGLSFDEAATVPITYLTAYYALVELARVQRGDSVLIHAAAGGVGVAALQIASWIGAKVIATVGSKEKEEYVRSLGVSHVFHSRSLDFGTGVMEATGGRGVDVVLNSLTGDFISRSFEVLAPYGRFVELGKRDIYEDKQIGLFPFRKNISFYAVDLAAALEERSEYVISLLQKILRHIEAGDWKPLPITAFPAAEPSEPFRFMAQARHIGKIAIQMGRDVRALPAADRPLFSKNASYLITGGLGGIALKVAAWMAENGAGHLVLASRRAVNNAAAATIRSIETVGAAVHVKTVDITREEDVDRLFSTIRTTMPPLKGIMHAAALMDVALIRDLSPERFRSVMAPKIEGTWRLHEATLREHLDFFILYSSIGAIHPQPGMANYAAANAFLDAFAHYRRALGMPATSINWAVWDEIGLTRAAESARSFEDSIEAYALQGLKKLSTEEGLRILESALREDPTQVVAVPFEWKTVAEFYGPDQAPLLFADFTARAATGATNQTQHSEVLDLLNGAESTASRIEIMEAYLQETLSVVLKLARRKLDKERPMGTMGLDSLMGLEFVRRLSKALEIAVPATVVFNYPTIRVLAPHLIQRLQLPLIEAQQQEMASNASKDAAFTALPVDLSEEDALEALIGKKGSRT